MRFHKRGRASGTHNMTWHCMGMGTAWHDLQVCKSPARAWGLLTSKKYSKATYKSTAHNNTHTHTHASTNNQSSSEIVLPSLVQYQHDEPRTLFCTFSSWPRRNEQKPSYVHTRTHISTGFLLVDSPGFGGQSLCCGYKAFYFARNPWPLSLSLSDRRSSNKI